MAKYKKSEYHLIPEETKCAVIEFFIKEKNNGSGTIAKHFNLKRTEIEEIFKQAFKKKIIVKEWKKAIKEYYEKNTTL